MTIKTENWLGEYTSTIGTGDITLGGAIDGFAGFSNVGENVDVYYTVMDALDKETGIGTLTGGKLVRKDIHAILVDGAYVKNGSAINLSGNAQVYGTANAHFLDYVQAVANAKIVNTQAIAELKALQINGHALTASFNLTAADVGAHPDSWMPSTEALNVYQKDASDIRYLKTQDAEQVAGLVMRVGGAREQQLQQSINDGTALRHELLAGGITDRNGGLYLKDFISVTEYGVKFDNVTDNTAALNAAFQSGRKIWIPDPGEGNFAMATGTVYYDSRTTIMGPGKYRPVIKASASMPGELDLIAPINETYSSFSYLRNILMFDLCVDANGFNRAKTVGYVGEWGRAIRIGAIYDSLFIRVNAIGGPQHGIDVACWKDNHIGIGHAGTAVGRPFNIVLSECDATDWVYDDGITTHGCYDILIENPVSRITDAAKSVHTYAITQKGLEVDDGSVNIYVNGGRHYGNNTFTMGFSVATHADAPAARGVHFKGCLARECLTGFGAWADPNTTAGCVFPSDKWLCRNITFTDCTLVKPSLKADDTNFPSRFIDIQNFMSVEAEGMSLSISDSDGDYYTPLSLINLTPAVGVKLKNIKITGVPAIPAVAHVIPRGAAWVRISSPLSSDIEIDGFNIDNIGFVNRLISDTTAPALRSVKNLRCESIPADGQTKVAVYGSANAEFKNIELPAGMEYYRIGRTFTPHGSGDVDVYLTKEKKILGGITIRSETDATGAQVKPGITFDRQFSSASDPTGVNGKGSVAFRTSNAVGGAFSISAYHEDLGEYRPIVYARSTTSPAKAWNPVIDNDTALGEPANRWKVVYAASGAINTSDGREKTKSISPEALSEFMGAHKDAILDAWADVQIIAYQWLEAIAVKGEDVARWHFGVIAQQVRDAFIAHGLDGTRFGLLCYDEWSDEYQDVTETVEQDDGSFVEVPTGERIQTQVAGYRWGVRPDQCLFLEADLNRRNYQGLLARIEALEAK